MFKGGWEVTLLELRRTAANNEATYSDKQLVAIAQIPATFTGRLLISTKGVW